MIEEIDPIDRLQRAVRARYQGLFRDPSASWSAFHHAVRHFLKGNFIAAMAACRRAEIEHGIYSMGDVIFVEGLALRALRLSPSDDVLAVIKAMNPTTTQMEALKRFLRKQFDTEWRRRNFNVD